MTHIQPRPRQLSIGNISDEESDPEYDSESDEDDSPRSITWTNDVAVQEIQDYLEDQLVDMDYEEIVSNTTVLGTWFEAEDTLFLGLRLNIPAYFRVGALYTKHFGYIHEMWSDKDAERPYDVMKIETVNIHGFEEHRVILKTIWIRLIQRHWKNRQNQQGIKGLMSVYKIEERGAMRSRIFQ